MKKVWIQPILINMDVNNNFGKDFDGGLSTS